MEYVLATASGLAVAAILAVFWFLGILLHHYADLNEQAQEREERLLQMIVSLENRIHAKDLSGYMTLQSGDVSAKAERKPPMGRSDAEEAFLEERRMAVVESDNGDGYS